MDMWICLKVKPLKCLSSDEGELLQLVLASTTNKRAYGCVWLQQVNNLHTFSLGRVPQALNTPIYLLDDSLEEWVQHKLSPVT